MSEGTVRIGIVGAGANTREVHLPRLREIPGVVVVAVANRSRESGERVARQFGIPRVHERWQDLVADPDVDAVLVGTWPYLHRDVTVAALAAGRHVLCEARMAMNAQEARQMLAASRARPDLVAQLVPAPFTLELDLEIAHLLRSGFIGQPLVADIRATTGAFLDPAAPLTWRQDAAKSGLNVLALGIWYECTSRWIGHARRVMAASRTFAARRMDPETGRAVDVRVPDHVDVIGETASGVQVRLQASAVTGLAPGCQEAWLFGTEGTLRIDAGSKRLFGARRGERELREVAVAPERRSGWRVERDFVEAVRGGAAPRLTTFAEGVRSMEFTEAVALSASSGRLIELPADAPSAPCGSSSA